MNSEQTVLKLIERFKGSASGGRASFARPLERAALGLSSFVVDQLGSTVIFSLATPLIGENENDEVTLFWK